jgi:hypothetical protein
MINLTKIISFLGLGLTLIPSFFVFNNSISLDSAKILMFVGSLVWFIATPNWINKESSKN